MPDRQEKFWFHAKRHGYGWGLPARWQGWIVMLVYIGLVIMAALFLPGYASLAVMLVLTAMLVIVVVFTGEKPAKWRWGRD